MNLKHCSQSVKISHGSWRLTYIQALSKLLLLLVYYTQTKVNLVGLLEVRRHAHDLRKCFLCVIKRTIAIVEDTNAVPQFRFLSTGQLLNRITMKDWALTFGSCRWYRACWYEV